MTTRARRLLACAGLLALVAAGCGRTKDRAYSRGSTVTVAYCCGKQTLTPTWDMEAKFLVFLPLVAEDENGELEGRLARQWEHSPDYREWTYRLRTDVRWHDGVPVTAHDIKFTVDLLARVPGATPFLIESITVLDDSTVRVRYTQTTARWDSWWVYYPRHLLEHLDPKKIEEWEFWTRPVGNGPYRFVRYIPNTMMEFEANPDYYRGKPRIERVVLKFAGDAGLTELLSGNVDALPADPAEISKLSSDPRFRVYYQIGPDLARVIYWQNDHPLFRDPNIRRALTLAINRRELLQVLHLPDTLPIFDGVFTRRQLRRGQLPAPLPYDPAGARSLLDAAGWRVRHGNGVRERDGRPFRFTAIVLPGTSVEPGDEQAAVYVQDQLRRVGVWMDLKVLGFGMADRLKTGKFEAVFWHFRHSSWWLQRYFGKDSPMGYRNAVVARRIEQAMVTADPETLDGIYRELMEGFRADVPVTFLTPQVNTYIAHRRIRGLSSPWRTDPVEYMEDLWLDDRDAPR